MSIESIAITERRELSEWVGYRLDELMKLMMQVEIHSERGELLQLGLTLGKMRQSIAHAQGALWERWPYHDEKA